MSVGEELDAALVLLAEALAKLYLTDLALLRARDAAAASGKPTDGYESLRENLEAVVGVAAEQALATMRKMAEDEAGSRG